MTGLADFKAAIAMRDLVTRIVGETVERNRPKYRYATVVAIDRATRKCEVQYPGEPGTVEVNMGGVQPREAGQTVRIDGLLGDRFVSDVMGPIWEYSSRVICTSTTRPGSAGGDAAGYTQPYQGLEIYELDTLRTLFYAFGGWYPAWNNSIGIVAETEDNSGGAFAATAPELCILQDVQLYTSRKYRFYWSGVFRTSVADTLADWSYQVSPANVGSWTAIRTLRSRPAAAAAANSTDTISAFSKTYTPPSNGLYDFRIVGSRVGGTGTVTLTTAQQLFVLDGGTIAAPF